MALLQTHIFNLLLAVRIPAMVAETVVGEANTAGAEPRALAVAVVPVDILVLAVLAAVLLRLLVAVGAPEVAVVARRLRLVALAVVVLGFMVLVATDQVAACKLAAPVVLVVWLVRRRQQRLVLTVAASAVEGAAQPHAIPLLLHLLREAGPVVLYVLLPPELRGSFRLQTWAQQVLQRVLLCSELPARTHGLLQLV